MPDPPTVTFLFTDIEGSTRLVQHLGDHYARVLADHHRILVAAFEQAGALQVESRGDGFFATFASAERAVAAAATIQRTLAAHAWPEGVTVRVRIGLHSGEPLRGAGGYEGLDVHRAARIMAAGHGEQVLLSDATQRLVGSRLPEGVGVSDLGSHRLKDLLQPEHLHQLIIPGLAREFPPLKSLGVRPHNLPIQVTSFVGREHELDEVKALLGAARLVTVTGAGGSGKTRLALQVAAETLEGYPDGVWLVEFAALADPTLVPQQVSAALHLRDQPGLTAVEVLAEYLDGRHLLLVLDNCEHLLDACARLADHLLRVCPAIRVLATSREPLGIAGETVYRLPTLAAPEAAAGDPAHLARFDAVRLFVDRATAALPGFALTTQTAPAVAQICHRLDGIPLAIELAAARVRALPVDEIAARLDDRFALLTGGSRTALPRHQTLRAALDWSHGLLSQPERTLLRRLAAFAGGWTLESARAVCADGIGASEIVELLTRLVDKSLVIYEPQRSRYHLLDTVRQYAWERLEEAGEADEVRTRHLDHYAGTAAGAERHLSGPEQGVWLDRLEADYGNVRAALDWGASDEARAEAALALAGAFWRFWYVRGAVTEGRQWLADALARGAGAAPRTRAKALIPAGNLAVLQGHYDEARGHLDAGLAIVRELGDQRGVAMALNGLGALAYSQGDYAAARSRYEETLAIMRDQNDESGAAIALNNLGNVAYSLGDYAAARTHLEESIAIRRRLGNTLEMAGTLGNLGNVTLEQGDYAAARALLEEALAIQRQLGDRRGVSITLNNLGGVLRVQGDHPSARAYYEESLSLRRELGDREGVAISLHNLGGIALKEGDLAAARALYRECLAMSRDLGDRGGIVDYLEGFAHLAVAEGRARHAALLFGAAEALREAIGAAVTPVDRGDYDRSVAAARAAVGEEAFRAARAEGRTMSVEAAIELALADGT